MEAMKSRHARQQSGQRVGSIAWLGTCWKVLKSLDNLIHSGLELCESECLLHVRYSGGILAHRLIFLDAAPLRIHCDLGTVEAAMDAGGNDARYMANGALASLGQQINKLFLLCRIN